MPHSQYTVVDEYGRRINNIDYGKQFAGYRISKMEDIILYVYYCFECDNSVEYEERVYMKCSICKNFRYVRTTEDDKDHKGYSVWKR